MITKEKLREALKKLWAQKKATLVVAAGVLGMLFIAFSTVFTPGTQKESDAQIPRDYEVQAYARQLETQLVQMLSSMEGVGACNVLVTMASEAEKVYAVEQNLSTNQSNQYEQEVLLRESKQADASEKYIVVEESGGKKHALMKTVKLPAIQGVVVVCDGAGNPLIRQRVTEAVATAAGISYTRIYVTQ